MTLLRVENVSKHFGSLVAVDGVSMTVEPGELRAVIGPNGAGKTTFFNLISGFLSQTSGKIIFDGEDISGLLPARRVWRGIARTFQITEVFPELTIRENLKIAVEDDLARGLREKAADQVEEGGLAGAVRADHGAQFAGLDDHRHLVDRDQAAEMLGDVLDAQQAHVLAFRPKIPSTPRGKNSTISTKNAPMNDIQFWPTIGRLEMVSCSQR